MNNEDIINQLKIKDIGKTGENPIILKGISKSLAITYEYDILNFLHNNNFILIKQLLLKNESKKFDVIEIKLLDSNEIISYYFDITDCLNDNIVFVPKNKHVKKYSVAIIISTILIIMTILLFTSFLVYYLYI